ncbi:MAG: hypothetical protein JSU72_10240 [Deltaproteobacteria bacterium]|nr:MAG: hypothetical protein JSU72_10240 [Deltaproteobacteria bacterium]
MSKPVKIRPVAWFLGGWLAVFAVLFPQGVVVCIGEPPHVELGILGSACCDEDSHLATALAGVSAGPPNNACTDCSHILATTWHYYFNRQPGKSFGRNVNVQSQPARVFAATFDNLNKDVSSAWLAVADPIPPLLLEHLSTSILIC